MSAVGPARFSLSATSIVNRSDGERNQAEY